MRRLIALLVIACATAVFLLGSGAGRQHSYQVRAIFNNAFTVIPGEDVKIAGVKVGKIAALDITPDQKAAVVLDITQPGFDDFRTDATCTIRPQSLIGERFVECTPTQPRVAGAQPAPPLSRVPKGRPGAGQYLLPDTQTTRPVDLDLIGDILRLPYRERFSILLNEFGTGLAGRGADLRQVIASADPALQATDQVLKILGDQNRVLDDLARQSDTVIAPLARERGRLADFIGQANTTAQATAQRGVDLQRNLQLLPPFLRQLKPTLARLGALSDQMTPVLSDLHSQAPAISHFIYQLGPFSRAARPALRGLGDASDVGRAALVKAQPIIRDLRAFASIGKPLAANLAALTTSLRDTGGVERVLDYIFYQVAAINGFDAFGHYLRAGLIVNLCSTYTTTPGAGCSANFSKTSPSTSRGAGRASPALAREALLLRSALARRQARRAGASSASARGRAGGTQARSAAATAGPPGPRAGASPPPGGSAFGAHRGEDPTSSGLLSYLLGNG